MDRQRGKMFLSDSLVGQLYRHCRQLFEDKDIELGSEFTEEESARSLRHDILLVENVPEGSPLDREIAMAVAAYAAYEDRANAIMARFGLSQEAEMVIGDATEWHPHQGATDKGRSADALKATYQVLVDSTRQLFFQGISSEETGKLWALAWLRYAYVTRMTEMKPTLLSFPWVAADILVAFSGTRPWASVAVDGSSATYNSDFSLMKVLGGGGDGRGAAQAAGADGAGLVLRAVGGAS